MAARRFVEALMARTKALAHEPERGPLYPVYGEHIRGLTLKPYLILYRATDIDVFIERIIHGARLPKNIR
jgi:toxin ParE1/3/4